MNAPEGPVDGLPYISHHFEASLYCTKRPKGGSLLLSR